VAVIRCSVDYSGRLDAHLPLATRLVMVKADGSVLIHSDGGSYKPLNWMAPPCSLSSAPAALPEDIEAGVREVWTCRAARSEDTLTIRVHELLHDSTHHLGVDPGLQKAGVETHLQKLLAEQVGLLGEGMRLIRREYPTAIGPVDLLVRDPAGGTVAVEVKRHGQIDGVEQLTRYLDLLSRDPSLSPVRGVLAAQQIKPQARVLATDRGIGCLLLDYDAMRGADEASARLF
jgi:RecB family endonuclease NucS